MTSAQCLAAIRIGLGLYFFTASLQKLSGNYMGTGAGLGRQLQQGLDGSQGFYQPFLSAMVIPNVDVVARMVLLGEFCVGVSLMLGLLTRAGGIVAVILTLNYMLMKGLPNSGGSVDRFILLVALMLVVSASGLVWGLDGAFRGSFSRIPIIDWLAGADDPAPQRRPAFTT